MHDEITIVNKGTKQPTLILHTNGFGFLYIVGKDEAVSDNYRIPISKGVVELDLNRFTLSETYLLSSANRFYGDPQDARLISKISIQPSDMENIEICADNLKYLHITDSANLKSVICISTTNKEVYLQNNILLESVSISGSVSTCNICNTNVASLTRFPLIENLYVSDTPIVNIDVSNCEKLKVLTATNTPNLENINNTGIEDLDYYLELDSDVVV